jgi:uncharacterized protein (DUF1786 family)
MKILTVDIGTGTQDIFLFDSSLSIENGFKLVLPSPTMMVRRRIQQATSGSSAIVLTGRQMGGGPSAWAAQEHARLGLPVFATPDAALTLDDDPTRVAALGVQIISEEEALLLPENVVRIESRDFDFELIASVFSRFGVQLKDLDCVAVAVFDHGAAPPGLSDRQFRFNYLDLRIRERNALTSFAFLSSQVPAEMSRLQSVAHCASSLGCPLIVMDTAPAAVLGATFDPIVAKVDRPLIVNIGNFHTLAFRLSHGLIEGLFEHHTGEIDAAKLEGYLRALAAGTLKHKDVFSDMGHGALIYPSIPLELGGGEFDVVVTGPRRGLLRPETNPATRQLTPGLRRYFAVPFGDMMLSGCFGLLAAAAELLPDAADVIQAALRGSTPSDLAPWDAS